MDRLAHVLGPAITRFEDCGADDARGIAQPVNMNSQGAALRAVRRLRLRDSGMRAELAVSAEA